MSEPTTEFNPESWDGDANDLAPDVVERLLYEADDLCDRTFSSKHEAFATGFFLGGKQSR